MRTAASIPLILMFLTLVTGTVLLRGMNVMNNATYSLVLVVLIATGFSLRVVRRQSARQERKPRTDERELGPLSRDKCIQYRTKSF